MEYNSTQLWFEAMADYFTDFFSEDFKDELIKCGFVKPNPIGVQSIDIKEGITEKRLLYQQKLQEKLAEIGSQKEEILTEIRRQKKNKRRKKEEAEINKYRTLFNKAQSEELQLARQTSLPTSVSVPIPSTLEQDQVPQDTWWQRLRTRISSGVDTVYNGFRWLRGLLFAA